MARRKKKRARKKHDLSLNNLSLKEIKEKGEQYLFQEKFQNAIKCFKEIIKNGADADTIQSLAKAYQGRIQSLAGKSLVKEALALFETMEQHCGTGHGGSLKPLLLLKAGNYVEAANLFSECRSQLLKKEQQRFDVLFGALLLVDSGLQPEDFPEHSPVVLNYPHARTALEKMCENTAEEALQALQAISFRSPYRDFRTLLTGCLHWQQDKEKAAGLLKKIPTSSPYFQFSTKVLAAQETPAAILAGIAQSSKNEEQEIRRKHGLSAQQFRCLKELGTKGLKPRELYNIVKKNSACFLKKEKALIIQNILPFLRDHALDILPRHTEISLSDRLRLAALAAEEDGVATYAVDFWDDYLQEIDTTDPGEKTKNAHVLRYQANLMEIASSAYLPEEILEKLLKSLEHDSTHTDTWLKAAKFAGKYTTFNRQYKILNDAVTQLPEDVPLLLATMRAAGQRGAHKKAGLLARQVLRLDPINISALDFLVESHLEHARKLTSQKKWALAEKELSKEDSRVKSVRLRGRRLICLGMIFLLQKKEEGLDLIVAGSKKNSTKFLGHLLTSLESRLFHLPVRYRKRFDKELRQAISGQFERQEFLRLISWMLSFTGEQWLKLKECSHLLKSFFSKAAGISWQQEEGVLICKALDRAELYISLAKVSDQLLKHFPKDASIKAYHLLGKYQNKPQQITGQHHYELYDLLDILEEKRSFELADRLESLLHHGHGNPDGNKESNDFFFFDDDEDDTLFTLPKSIDKKKKEKTKKTQPPNKQLDLFDFLK